MRKHSFSDEQFIESVKSNVSIAGVLRQLNLPCYSGGHYRMVNSLVRQLNLDISHWTGKSYLKGKTHNYSKSLPDSDILVENSSYNNTHTLKKRLLKNKQLKEECYECQITHWQGRQLSLHLDHINGVSNDNRLENLRLLCPNCHSLTETYCGKSKRYNLRPTYIKNGKKRKATGRHCLDCDTNISYRSLRCKSCAMKGQRPKIDWPDSLTLQKMVENTSYLATAKKLGITDNAIRNRLRNHPA